MEPSRITAVFIHSGESAVVTPSGYVETNTEDGSTLVFHFDGKLLARFDPKQVTIKSARSVKD